MRCMRCMSIKEILIEIKNIFKEIFIKHREPNLGIFILLILFLGTTVFTLNRLVFPKNETIVEKTIDLPLSRCTVDFNCQVFEDAVNQSDWAKCSGGVLKAVTLDQFKALVNKNDLAEKISAEYPDLFKWDPKGVFTMPTENEFIKVPTWILFAFSEYLDYSE